MPLTAFINPIQEYLLNSLDIKSVISSRAFSLWQSHHRCEPSYHHREHHYHCEQKTLKKHKKQLYDIRLNIHLFMHVTNKSTVHKKIKNKKLCVNGGKSVAM